MRLSGIKTTRVGGEGQAPPSHAIAPPSSGYLVLCPSSRAISLSLRLTRRALRPGIEKVLQPLVASDAKVLVVGCGNSRLSADVFDNLTQSVTSIDQSQVVVADMKKKYSKKPALVFSQMDVRNLDFKAASFDVVIDKALTDCLLCGDEGEDDLGNALAEVSRVLRPGGSFVCVSFGEPDSRADYLQTKSLGWDLQTPVSVPKPSISSQSEPSNEVHWCYVCKRKS